MPTSALLSDLHRTAVDTATLQLSLRGPILFCLARKERGEKRRWRRVILRAQARDFWPLRGLNALFGRKADTFPIAYGSGKCTTRIYGQTASTSVLLISGILGQSCSCTAKIHSRTQIFCTIGEHVDASCIPWQGVLPSPCMAAIFDGSVVSTQAAL